MVEDSDTETLTSATIHRVVDDWEMAKKSVERAQEQLEKAHEHLKDVTQDLGAMLAPDQSLPGDRFHIWIRRDTKRESLLVVTVECFKDEKGDRKKFYGVSWWQPRA